MNENSPDDLAALEAELAEAEHRVVHRIDPGPTALPVAVAVLVDQISLLLPWTGSRHLGRTLLALAGLAAVVVFVVVAGSGRFPAE